MVARFPNPTPPRSEDGVLLPLPVLSDVLGISVFDVNSGAEDLTESSTTDARTRARRSTRRASNATDVTRRGRTTTRRSHAEGVQQREGRYLERQETAKDQVQTKE